MADPLKDRVSLLQEAEAQAIARGKTLKPEAQAELDRYRAQGIVKTAPNESNLARDNLRADAIAKIKLARSLRDRSKNQYFTTGVGSNIAGFFPGSAAYDLARDTETLKNAGALQRIMEMARDNGGKNPLTPLSNSDFQALASSLSNLDPGQSDEQYQKNLDVVENLYRRAYQSAGGGDLEAEISGKPADKNNGGAVIGGGTNPTGTPPAGTPPTSPTGGPPDETGKYAGSDIRMHMDSPENAQGYRFTPTQETALHEYLTSGNATPEGYGRMMTAFAAAQGVNVDDAYTQSATAQGQKLIEAAKAGKLGDGMSYNESDKNYRDRLLAEQDKRPLGDMATGQLLTSGVTAGLSDEISGVVGGAKSFLEGKGFQQGYRHDRDTVRAVRDRAYEERPIISGATEMLGALATPGGVARDVMRGGTLAERIAAGAKAGGRQGIAAGYGYGEGAGDSIKGAVIGGATGALIGGGLPIAAKGISSVYGVAAKRPVIAGGQQLADAAAAENVPISRPFLDPSVRNKMTYLETTRGGNAPVRQGMQDTADAIETRAGQLGAGGNVLDSYAGGQAIQDAGKSYIKRAKSLTDRLYDRARAAVPEGVKIEPVNAVAEIDRNIAELSKTPGTNAGTIKYLETLRNDLSTGGLDIDALRGMRTNMRGQISERNLTFTDAERRVTGIMNAASRDIQTQLAEKAPMAGARYARADAAFKSKQDKIERAIRPFLGPRLNNIEPEAAFSRFESMAKNRGNRDALQSIWKEIPPNEQRDLAATFAEPLGKDKAGDFSPALFIADAAKLSPVARQTIFGPEGAQSVANLVRLSNAWRKVSRNLNNSRSGVAFNYRDTIGSAIGFVGGGAVGAMEGGATSAGVAALATAAAVNGVKQTRNFLSARALMSPNVAKWLKQTPTNPAAIESHIARLSSIAAREPAISGDVISLQNYLAAKFSETPSRAAATPGQDRNDRRPPPINNGQ